MADNIFTQTAAWNRDRSERAKQRADESAREASNREVNRVVKLRNGQTGADEALIIIKIALGLVTLFTAYCGWLYYNDTFSRTFHPAMGFVFACGLALLVEAAKVYLAHLSLRSIFFGWMFRDWWSVGAWSVVWIIAIGAFYWSVDVSTDGMKRLTSQQGEERTKSAGLNAHLSEATAAIDGQIKSAQAAQERAQAAGTKRSRLTADKTADQITILTSDREKIVAAATKEFLKGEGKREVKVEGWAAWVKKFGGYMEAAAGLCLLAWGFFERRLYSENLVMLEKQQGEEQRKADQMAGF